MRYSICMPQGFFVALLAIGAAISAFSPVQAAPVTFRFEAEVFNVSRTSAVAIDLDVENGNKLTGEITFEPFFLPPLDNPLEQQDAVVFQSYGASLQIGGVSFSTPAAPNSLMLTAINNVIVFDGPSTQLDQIKIGSLLNPVDPPGLPGVASGEFMLEFWGRHTLLSSAGVSGEAAILNDFEFLRNLQIRLVDTSGERLIVTALVGDLFVVPEPSTLALLLLGGVGPTFIQRRRS